MKLLPLPKLFHIKQSFSPYQAVFLLVFFLLVGFAGGGALYGQEPHAVNQALTRDGENPDLPDDHGQDGNQDADGSGTMPTQQELNLYPGWNWVSFYLHCDAELFAALQEGIAQNNTGSLIKDMSSNTTLQDGVWSASNLVFNNKTMYMILLENNTTLTLNGFLADPTQCTNTLYPGWNWIGFPLDHTVPIGEALSDFQAHEGDVLKDMAFSATYSGDSWEGSLTQLVPGRGYMYLNTGNAVTLTYPLSK